MICQCFVFSYTESAQPTPMDISQENVEADSLSCPESDSLLPPSSGSSSRPPVLEDLPRDVDYDAATSTSEKPLEVLVGEELESLTIDVVEAWRIVAPPHPHVQSGAALKVDLLKPMPSGGSKAFAEDTAFSGGESSSKSEVTSPGSESGAFDVYR